MYAINMEERLYLRKLLRWGSWSVSTAATTVWRKHASS